MSRVGSVNGGLPGPAGGGHPQPPPREARAGSWPPASTGAYPGFPVFPVDRISAPCFFRGDLLYPARRLILYSPIFRVSVLRCMPRAQAVLVRLPSDLPSTREMKRFSNSRTASSNWTPLTTIASQCHYGRSRIILITVHSIP